MASEKGTLYGIQGLRGLAACIVVVLHATQAWSVAHVGSTVLSWNNGAAGVDIFFVISGFVMAITNSNQQKQEHPARTFLEKRFIRLFPMYWLMTSVYLVVVLRALHATPVLAQTPMFANLTRTHILESWALIPFHNLFGRVEPVLVVGWTLSFEIFFYLLFAFALSIQRKPLVVLAPIMIGLVVCGAFRTPAWPAFFSLADPLLLEFLAGILIWEMGVKGYTRASWKSALAGVTALLYLLVAPLFGGLSYRVPQWGIGACILVWSSLCFEEKLKARLPRWIVIIGEASYSLYLSHLIFMNGLVKVTALFHLRMLASMLMIVPSLIGVGLVCHFCVERPMTDYLRRSLSLRRMTVFRSEVRTPA